MLKLLKLLKLLKYEARYYARILPLMYGALVLLAVAFGIKERVNASALSNSPYEFFLMLLVVVGGIACAITLVFIVHRFVDNLLKAPGYLSLTLPVTVWHLIAAKAAAAVCAALATAVTCLASEVILFLLSFQFDTSIFVSLAESMRFDNALSWVKSALLVIVVTFQQAALIYALITASRLLPKFRNFAAVAGWFFIGGIESGILNALGNALSISFTELSFAAILAQAAFACLFFLAAGFLLKKTFNAE